MTEKELNKLFAEKLKGQSFPFNEKAWDSMEQMLDPQEPLSEMEYSKLFKNKLSAASFAFNPANWSAMETKLNEEQGAMTQEEVKKLFETKLQSQSFKFNPANWERMEAILDGSPKKGLLYFWRSVAAIFLFAATAIAFQFNDQAQLFSPNSIENISASPKETSSQPKTLAPEQTQVVAPKAQPQVPVKEQVSSASQGAINTPPSAPTNKLIASSQTPSSATNAVLSNDAYLDENSNEEALVLGDNASLSQRNWKDLPAIKSVLAFRKPPGLSSKADIVPKKTNYVPVSYSKISLQAGPSVNPAYNGSTGTGFFAGLEYEYGFNDRLSLSAGLTYNYGGDMGIESISDSTFFGLARTDVETHSHYKNMTALRMPISLNIKFSPKHSFSLGAYADAIIAMSMDQQKTTTIFKQDPKVEKMSGSAPKSSFASFSGGANFAYTYQYSDRFSIGLSQQYGFVDLTNDQKQNFKKHHQTSQTNLVLKFSIWER